MEHIPVLFFVAILAAVVLKIYVSILRGDDR